MTICISIKVPDGLVLAADSMSTYSILNPATQRWDIIQSYSYANKLIPLGSASMGVLVWGIGSVQRRSLENLVDEFSRRHLPSNPQPEVESAATTLSTFIRTAYEQSFPDPQKRPVLGFLVGGYDKSSPFARQWAFEFPATPNPQEILPGAAGQPQFGIQWFGQTDALTRLITGFDLRLIQALKKKGFDPAAVDDFFSMKNLFTLKIPYEIVFDGMPLQDAIDFAAFLIHVVKGRFRFVIGPKLCGGPVDIAVVKPEGFEWICRKVLSHDANI